MKVGANVDANKCNSRFGLKIYVKNVERLLDL